MVLLGFLIRVGVVFFVSLGKVWLCKDTHVLFSASDEGGNSEEDTSDSSDDNDNDDDDDDDDGGSSGEEDTGDSGEDLSTSGCDQLIGLVPTVKRRKLANNVSLNLSLKSGRYPTYKGGPRGPSTDMDPHCNSPVDYLELVWPASLVDLVASETNRYAVEKGICNWVSVSRDELWTFLGIVVLMGINRLPRISNYWSKDTLLGRCDIQRCMTLKRFMSIWSNLHVVDNSTVSDSSSLSAKIQPVLDVLERTFYMQYAPGQELCVDEAMIKYKGGLKKGKVKMPHKPVKEGFKVWCCCCSCCGYLCTFQLYKGKPINPTTGKKVVEKGLVKRVVLDLVRLYAGSNHVLYLDNFFTSGPLVDALAEIDIYTAGTIRQKARGFPLALKGVKPAVGAYVSECVGTTVYYTFHDRKVVSLVSNAFPEDMRGRVVRLPSNDRVLQYQKVPPVLPAYNKYMGAVDHLSQTRKTYGFDRKSKRYWIRPFMTFFDYAVNNAFILYKHNCSKHNVRPLVLLRFRLELARSLMKRTPVKRRRTTQVARSDSLVQVCCLVRVAQIGSVRGRCQHCVNTKKAKICYTSFGCSNCRVRLCKVGCFAEYHKD